MMTTEQRVRPALRHVDSPKQVQAVHAAMAAVTAPRDASSSSGNGLSNGASASANNGNANNANANTTTNGVDENRRVNGAARDPADMAAKKSVVKDELDGGDDADDDAEDDDGDDDDDEDGKGKSAASAKDKDEDDKKASKKSRRELPPHTVAILKGWMLSPEHVKHPYPTDEDKQMLLKKTGINMKQLTNWFTNARKRIWKPMMRREHSRQLQTAMEYEKSRAREPFAGGPPMPYREPPYPPRQAMSHSFDAGSLSVPRDHAPQPYGHPYEGGAPPPPQAYAMAPPPPHAYPPRVSRSVSESATRHEMDDYIDALRIRKRVHEMSPDGVEIDGLHGDKRYRRAAGPSPRCLKILQDWVAAHAHMEYPLPADSDKLQLSRDTGLDVQQIELWFKNNVGRYGAPVQPPPPQQQQQQQQAPPTVVQHAHPAYRQVPSYQAPPPAYGERRSVPSQGNPMFPPRPSGARASIPGAGNSQFPPPPAVRRESSEGYRAQGVAAPYNAAQYAPPQSAAGYEAQDPSRPMRSMPMSNAPRYGHAHAPHGHAGGSAPPSGPGPAMPVPVGAPGGLPSLSIRATHSGPGPTMGQARDGRSHTLDMGLFAEARRRKMTFQDILASTSSPLATLAAAAPHHQHRPSLASADAGGSRSANAENVYPDSSGGAAAAAAYQAQQPKSYEQQPPQLQRGVSVPHPHAHQHTQPHHHQPQPPQPHHASRL